MYKESMKLHLIEEVLKTDNDAILNELETILKRSAQGIAKTFSAHELVGKWSKKDASRIETAIREGCEKIDEDGWK